MQINKTDLIKIVAEKANQPTKEVAEIIDLFFKELSQNLRDKDVSIKDFGTFKKRIVPPKKARNPATGETIYVPEKEAVKFRPSKNVLKMKWL
ncbi:histone family protein DNA-binding protein (plasmid) [Phocaeicola salanitronis DSM 18170]|uniref:Histone family protein DNA-binding protein n=1 Tax=Phocaeicola salanitronis (strain DSM 18170 / JCM 13657 / CCUG 60908 / BL78) TaxID=667015 RepID=F0R975_PHOSB|nr:HU family DNA-binding protein [Phocaeicola salanitronis]ADY38196.1 histone family protein DNA-binding protein [Phocaeicola salanitronis DSM 18170]